MNEIVQYQEPLTAMAIRAQVNLVQEVMQATMQKDVHYGTIPGTPKPTLYKPGAEKLCMTFRIAPSYKVEDLSTADVVRYRVTCIGKHQTSGTVMGEGMGECSSGEEKYKWRKAYDEEFAATPDDKKRIKYGKYTAKQVRTEPADLANTILKMACKRAQVAMTLNVTAASDIFTQDIEDLPEELRPNEGVPEEKMPAYLPTDVFVAQKAGWEKAITSGKKTIPDLVAWIEAKGTKLTEAQLKVINGWKKAEPEKAAEPEAKSEAIDLEDIPFN
jgi:hypothetical protein